MLFRPHNNPSCSQSSFPGACEVVVTTKTATSYYQDYQLLPRLPVTTKIATSYYQDYQLLPLPITTKTSTTSYYYHLLPRLLPRLIPRLRPVTTKTTTSYYQLRYYANGVFYIISFKFSRSETIRFYVFEPKWSSSYISNHCLKILRICFP